MKIADIAQTKPLQEVHDAENRQPAAAPKKRAARTVRDQVELSAAISGQSAARQEELQAKRIAAIKEKIEAGTYRVDSRQVAEKMLSREEDV